MHDGIGVESGSVRSGGEMGLAVCCRIVERGELPWRTGESGVWVRNREK